MEDLVRIMRHREASLDSRTGGNDWGSGSQLLNRRRLLSPGTSSAVVFSAGEATTELRVDEPRAPARAPQVSTTGVKSNFFRWCPL
jgi:hypothetical protein